MKKKAVKYLLATVLSVTCLFGSDMFAAPGLKYVFAGEQLGKLILMMARDFPGI